MCIEQLKRDLPQVTGGRCGDGMGLGRGQRGQEVVYITFVGWETHCEDEFSTYSDWGIEIDPFVIYTCFQAGSHVRNAVKGVISLTLVLESVKYALPQAAKQISAETQITVAFT
jgi:hypothetical protein